MKVGRFLCAVLLMGCSSSGETTAGPADVSIDTGAPTTETGADTAAMDASADTAAIDVGPDGAPADVSSGETASCDGMTCGVGQVCVIPCCAPPCKPARPHCVDIPTKCAGVPGCSCMADACTGGSACGGMIDGRLQCACF